VYQSFVYVLRFMGQTESTSVDSPSKPQRGRILKDPYKTRYETWWHSSFGTVEYISRAQFESVDLGFRKSNLRAVYDYLSLKKEGIEKELLEKRLVDLITHTVAASWRSIIEEVGMSPDAVLSVACGEMVASEASDIDSLMKQIPSIETAFNQSILTVILGYNTLRPLTNIPSNIIKKVSEAELIGLIVPESSNDPRLLYSSYIHGSSFRALFPAMKFYPGELLFLFETIEGTSRFGFVCSRNEWTETTPLRDFDQDATGTMMFQLYPKLRIRRPNRKGSSNYVYLNVSNPNHPVGVGLGGREGNFRFWLDGSNMGKVKVMESDATFEPKHFIENCTSDQDDVGIHSVEVWGLSGQTALDAQKVKKENEAEIRNDRKRVDKSRFVQNDFDKEMFFQKTFGDSSGKDTRLGNS
jgi:hypothetical protein